MNYLDDTLIIVNFNRPHYENIPFIRNVIYKDCPNIVFYGDSDFHNLEHPSVVGCPQNGGFFAYRATADAMSRFPGHRGYLFVMDDVLLNIRNLLGKDKDRIWFPELDPGYFMDVLSPHPTVWWAWESSYGLGKCRAAWEKFPAEYKTRLQTTLKIKNGVVGGFSDAYYIPGRLVEKWNTLISILSGENVFHEIAIPTALSAVEDFGDWDVLNIKYLWGVGPRHCSFTGDRVRWRSFLKKDMEGLHPVKFSDSQNQNTAKWFLDHADKKGMWGAYKNMLGAKELFIKLYYDFVGLTDYSICWIRKLRNRLRRIKKSIRWIFFNGQSNEK